MLSDIKNALDEWFNLELERIRADSPASAAAAADKLAAIEPRLIALADASGRGKATPPRFVPSGRRAAGNASPRFIIVGAGVGGLCMGALLEDAGFNNFVILEKASAIGGTWHQNTYPGVACDVNSYLYQFGFFKNHSWSSSFPMGREIHAYLLEVANHFNLKDRIQLNRRVTACVYRQGQWVVQTDAGMDLTADILISAVGFLHYPSIPAFEGLQNFGGPAFHSSRWDDTVVVKGRRVGIVGNGSSAVQIVPAIANDASAITVFQRTAQWIFPAPRFSYSQQRIAMLSRYPELVERLYDYYMEWYNAAFGNAVVGDEREKQFFRAACEGNLARISDPELRAKLTPPYPVMCKRLVLGDGYYEAFISGKAALVTEPITRIERDGVRTSDSKLHKLDVIVLATGFKTHEYCRQLNISDAGGVSLEEAWKDGAATLDSVSVAGIPNFFILGGPYSTIGNLSTMTCTEFQVRYIIELIREMCARGATSIAARSAAQNAFVKEMQEGASKTVWLEGCKSWYLDSNGRVDIWTKSAYAFVDKMVVGPDKDNYSFQ